LLYIIIGCPFQIAYIWDETEKKYKFNDKKTCFDHNHELSYKGLSKHHTQILQNYMQKQEINTALKPKEMKEKSQAFLQGFQNEMDLAIPDRFTFNLHRKVRSLVWGPNTEDANMLLNLAIKLQEKNPHHLTNFKVSSENKLECFVFSSANMKKLYSNFNDILLIDSTYRTNRYKMPLLIFAALSENAKIIIIGFAIVISEQYEDIHWVFQNLFGYLETQPKIVCTDSCPTLKKTIANILPESNHLLYGWHVSQNLKKHLSGLSKSFYTF